MDDINDLASLPNPSTPDEAAKNINNANLFGMDPTDYKPMSPLLDPKADALNTPQFVTPALNRFMRQSSEHLGLAKPDIPHLNFMEKSVQYAGDIIYNRATPERQLTELANKKMDHPDQFTTDDDLKMTMLNHDLKQEQDINYHNEPPSFPEKVGEAFADMGRSVRRNAELIGAFTGAGAGVGFFSPAPGGAAAGAITGFGLGVSSAFAVDAYDTGRGAVYNEMSNWTKPDGTPMNIDETTKSRVATGLGLISAALVGGSGAVASKATPFLSKFVSPVLAKSLFQDSANASVLKAISNIGEAVLAGGGAGGLMGFAHVVAQEMANNYDGTEASFLNALQSAGDRVKQQPSLVGEPAGIGAATTGILAAGLGAARLGTEPARTDLKDVSPLQLPPGGEPPAPPSEGVPVNQEFQRPSLKLVPQSPTDLMTERASVIQNLLDKNPDVSKLTPNEAKYHAELTEELQGINEKLQTKAQIKDSTDVLQLQDALESMNKAASETKMNELSPLQMQNLKAEQLAQAGIGDVWIAKNDLAEIVNSPEFAKEARDWIDPEGTAKAKLNAPINIPPEKFVQFMERHPEISDLMRQKSDGPSANEGRELLTKYQDEQAKRIQFLKGLGLTGAQPSPEEPPVTTLTPKPKSQVPFDLEGHARRVDEILKALATPKADLTKPGFSEFQGKIIPDDLYRLHLQKGDLQFEVGRLERQKEQFEKDHATLRNKLANEQPVNLDDFDAVKISADMTRAQFAQQKVKVEKDLVELQSKIDNFQDTPRSTLTPLDRTKLESEIQDIKSKVQEHFRQGKILVGDWAVEPKANAFESDFLNQATYTRMLATVIPNDEQEKFNKAVASGKESVKEDIDFALNHEMNKVQDVVKLAADQVALEEEKERIENDPRYALVDRFRGHKIKNQKGRAKSVFSINPETLTDEQLHYLDNARLKEHGVFNKPGHGNSPDQAAQLIGGVKDGDDLLKILAGTPTRAQITKARVAVRSAQNRIDAIESTDLNWTTKLKSYDNKLRLGILLMKYMREKEWPATKQGIKRIAFEPPQPRAVQIQARTTVMKSKVGSLNFNQYKVGERQSRKVAVTAFVDGQFEKAFIALEAQAMNIAMQKHTLLATGQVNKALSFIASLSTKHNKAVIERAGAVFTNARDEILDTFNFNPSKKGRSKADAFMNWVQSELRKGRGDFSIPEHLSDVRGSVNDLTVEQLLTITERLRAILHLARMKNRLFTKHAEAKQEQYLERLRDQVQKLLVPHRFYDIGKLPPIQQNNSRWRHLENVIRTAESVFTNMEHVARELDDEKLGGFFQALLVHPLKGDGAFYQETGYTRELQMTAAFKEHHDHLVKNYGDGFRKIESVKFDVKEFAKVKELNYGKNLTKGDLMTLWVMGGDPYVKEKRFENNGGVGHDVMQTVFEKHLEVRDVVYAQACVDMFKDYRKETEALQKEVTGQGVQFVEGIPNLFKGVWYSGGYMPAKYRIDYTKEGAKQLSLDLKGKKAAWHEKDPMRAFANEQTEQGRLISRTGSDKPLDYSWMRFMRGHEEVIHDLSYRKAVINALAILKDPTIEEHIIARVGVEKYKLLVSTVIEIATKAEADNVNYFADQNRWWKWLQSNLKKKFDVTVLAMNPSSMIVQFASTGQTIQNMGVKNGLKHWTLVNAKMAARPDLYAAFYHWANELDPTIGHFLEGLHNKLVSNVMEAVPKKGSHGLQITNGAYEKMVNGLMSPMQIMDVFIKVQAAIACYSQFISGDVEGFPLEKIMKMSPKERYAAAQGYVSQISRLSLTHGRPEDRAPFQKIPGADFLSYYWNDARNGLNNIISQYRKGKAHVFDLNEHMGDSGGGFNNNFGGGGGGKPPTGPGADKAAPEGPDRKAANVRASQKSFNAAAGIILATSVCQMFVRMWEDKTRGNQETPLDAGLSLKTAADRKAAAEYVASYLSTSIADQFATNHPLGRAVLFAASNVWQKSKTKKVDIPITKELSDFATTATYLSDYLSMGVSPTRAQVMAILHSESYLMYPTPLNGVNHLGKMFGFDDPIMSMWNSATGVFDPSVTGTADKLHAEINQWKEQHGESAPKEFVAQLDKIQQQISQDPVNVPHGTADQIKYAENQGDWTKPPISAPKWNDIMDRAPQLGLTEGGRTAKDQTQVDKALKWENEQNAQTLGAKNVPVNEATLYGAHKLGAEKYAELHNTPGDQKAKSVLGPEDIKANPEIAPLKTVGAVKQHFQTRTSEAAKNLTLQTSNSED